MGGREPESTGSTSPEGASDGQHGRVRRVTEPHPDTKAHAASAFPRRNPEGGTVPRGVPSGPYRAILEARAQAALDRLRRDNEHASAAATVREEAEERLRIAVGSEALAGWRRHVAETREEARRARADLSGAEDYAEQEARRLERTRAEAARVLPELGIDRAKVRQVQEWARMRYHEVTESGLQSAPGMAQLVHKDDPVIQALDSHVDLEWLMFTPPYHTQDAWSEGWSSDFGVEVASHVNSLVGQVGERVRLGNGDASNFDAAAMSGLSTNSIIFITPGNGPLEVLVEAQSLGAHHHLRLEDEWGISEANVTQKNWLTMQTFTGGASVRREILTSHFRIKDATDGHWDTHFIHDGDTFWLQFFSDRAFQEGEIIWMDLGSISYNFSNTNDVEVFSTVDFTWFLRQVLVRPTGV